MLAYLTRTVPTIARAALRRDGRLVSHLKRRVPLQRIDLNVHMKQAAYAEVAELGRADWIVRSRAWERWRAEGINPVVAEQRIVYRRELKPLQAYEIDTRATGIDGRLLRLDSHLLVGNRVHTVVQAKLIFVGPEGVLPAERVEPLCAPFLTDALRIEDWRVVG